MPLRVQAPSRGQTDTMGLWATSVLIFKAICTHGQQSVRSLAERIGLSKSSVHRHLQAMDRRDRSPESSLWETEAGRTWLIRLRVATLLVCGLKRGVGTETGSEFLGRLHLDAHVGCSPAPCEPSCPGWSVSSSRLPQPGRKTASLMARYARASGPWTRPLCSACCWCAWTWPRAMC